MDIVAESNIKLIEKFKTNYDENFIDQNLSNAVTRRFTQCGYTTTADIDKSIETLYESYNITKGIELLANNIAVPEGNEGLTDVVDSIRSMTKTYENETRTLGVISSEYHHLFRDTAALMRTIDLMHKQMFVGGIQSGYSVYEMSNRLFKNKHYKIIVFDFVLHKHKIESRKDEINDCYHAIIRGLKDLTSYYETLAKILDQLSTKDDLVSPEINEVIKLEIDKYGVFMGKRIQPFEKLADKVVQKSLPGVIKTLNDYIVEYSIDPNFKNPHLGDGSFKSFYMRITALLKAIKLKEKDLEIDKEFYKERKLQFDNLHPKGKTKMITYDPLSNRLTSHILHHSEISKRLLGCLKGERDKMKECIHKLNLSRQDVPALVSIVRAAVPRTYGGDGDGESYVLSFDKILQGIALAGREIATIHKEIGKVPYVSETEYDKNKKLLDKVSSDIESRMQTAINLSGEIRKLYLKLHDEIAEIVKNNKLGSDTEANLAHMMHDIKKKLMTANRNYKNAANDAHKVVEDVEKYDTVGMKFGGKKKKKRIVNGGTLGEDLKKLEETPKYEITTYVDTCIEEYTQSQLLKFEGFNSAKAYNTYIGRVQDIADGFKRNFMEMMSTDDEKIKKSYFSLITANHDIRDEANRIFDIASKKYSIIDDDLVEFVYLLWEKIQTGEYKLDPVHKISNTHNPLKVKFGKKFIEFVSASEKIYSKFSTTVYFGKQAGATIITGPENIMNSKNQRIAHDGTTPIAARVNADDENHAGGGGGAFTMMANNKKALINDLKKYSRILKKYLSAPLFEYHTKALDDSLVTAADYNTKAFPTGDDNFTAHKTTNIYAVGDQVSDAKRNIAILSKLLFNCKFIQDHFDVISEPQATAKSPLAFGKMKFKGNYGGFLKDWIDFLYGEIITTPFITKPNGAPVTIAALTVDDTKKSPTGVAPKYHKHANIISGYMYALGELCYMAVGKYPYPKTEIDKMFPFEFDEDASTYDFKELSQKDIDTLKKIGKWDELKYIFGEVVATGLEEKYTEHVVPNTFVYNKIMNSLMKYFDGSVPLGLMKLRAEMNNQLHYDLITNESTFVPWTEKDIYAFIMGDLVEILLRLKAKSDISNTIRGVPSFTISKDEYKKVLKDVVDYMYDKIEVRHPGGTKENPKDMVKKIITEKIRFVSAIQYELEWIETLKPNI